MLGQLNLDIQYKSWPKFLLFRQKMMIISCPFHKNLISDTQIITKDIVLRS